MQPSSELYYIYNIIEKFEKQFLGISLTCSLIHPAQSMIHQEIVF